MLKPDLDPIERSFFSKIRKISVDCELMNRSGCHLKWGIVGPRTIYTMCGGLISPRKGQKEQGDAAQLVQPLVSLLSCFLCCRLSSEPSAVHSLFSLFSVSVLSLYSSPLQPLPSNRQYLSCDACLEVEGRQSELLRADEQFLQFSGLGFVTLGPFHCA